MKLRALGILSISLSWACNAGDGIVPPLGLPHSTASHSCAPNDGAAVSVHLTPDPTTTIHPPPPYVRISIWRPVGELVGRWNVSQNSADGFATYVDNTTEFQPASSGVVRIVSVSGDNTITGTVDLVFSATRRVRGDFRARWISAQPGALCG